MNPALLSDIAARLNHQGRNYTVFLKAYQTEAVHDATLQKLVSAALNRDAIVERVVAVGAPEVLSEIESCVLYRGDAGAGPSPETLHSAQFKESLSALLSDVSSVILESQRVDRFQFKHGHPAYPVFWDFAFLFVGASCSTVLVGSSSD